MEKQKIQTDEYYLQGAVIKGCAGLIKVTDHVHFFCLLHRLLWGNASKNGQVLLYFEYTRGNMGYRILYMIQ